MSQVHIHGDSARIGVQLAFVYLQNTIPPADLINRILSAMPPNITKDEFSLEMATAAGLSRSQRRRDCAMQVLAALVHHAGDATLISTADMSKLVELAWGAARTFEEQDNAAGSLDSLRPTPSV